MNQQNGAEPGAKREEELKIVSPNCNLSDETKEEAARLVTAIAACSIRQHESKSRDKYMWQGERALTLAEHQWLYPTVSTFTPSDADHQRRVRVIKWLSELVARGVWRGRGLTVQPYGSFVSGLYSPGGDLDIALEGFATVGTDGARVALKRMEGRDRQKFLHRLADKLQSCSRVDKMERITHARVPILRWLDVQEGIPVDLAISQSDCTQLKSIAVGFMSQFDPRASALIRLVKLWARAHGMNSPPDGTFNSYALTLMVIFHLQTRNPPILPTFREVFGGKGSVTGPTMQDLASANDYLVSQLQNHRDRWSNTESLCQLLASFFALYRGIMVAWYGGGDPCLAKVLKNVRIDTWNGVLTYGAWAKLEYKGSIEDPFERHENCARTLRCDKNPNRFVVAFSRGLEAFDILFGTSKAESSPLQSQSQSKLKSKLNLKPKSQSEEDMVAAFYSALFGSKANGNTADHSSRGSSLPLPRPRQPFIPRSVRPVIGDHVESVIFKAYQRGSKFQPDFKPRENSFALEASRPFTSQEIQMAERVLNSERPFEVCPGLDCAKYKAPEDPEVKLKVRLEQIQEALKGLRVETSCWVAVREESLLIARELARQCATEESRQKVAKEERRKRKAAKAKGKDSGANSNGNGRKDHDQGGGKVGEEKRGSTLKGGHGHDVKKGEGRRRMGRNRKGSSSSGGKSVLGDQNFKKGSKARISTSKAGER